MIMQGASEISNFQDTKRCQVKERENFEDGPVV